MSQSPINRIQMENTLKKTTFDLLIIGGGITGAGIALDAATRGIQTALVEMQDFSAGTSSRSTKLVHGGLRYLKQLEVKMVAEVGKERAVVYENGPHVTTPEWMLLPFHKGGTFGSFSTSLGLRVYDFLAGVKKSERRKMLSKEETLTKKPLIKKEGLKGGGYYVEYRTDDSRLTTEVIKAAIEKGATAINYTKVEKLLYDSNGVVNGATVCNLLTEETYEIKAKVVVNATGPWVDYIRELDHSKKGKSLQLTKGIHLVIDQSIFPLKQAIYFDTPDGRMVFAIPRGKKAYIGTTDTFYKEDPISPTMSEADRNYILDAIRYMFPSVKVTVQDVEASWAGVRPLILEDGKDPSEISRKDEIWESNSQLITIAGGKLTGYRKMAETVVDLVGSKIGQQNPCITKDLPISGGDVGGSVGFPAFVAKMLKKGEEIGIREEVAKEIVMQYGSNTPIIYRIIKDQGEKAEAYGLPLSLWASIQYAMYYELAVTPVDVLLRRTGLLLFDIKQVYKYKDAVLQYMEDCFQWNIDQTEEFRIQLQKEIKKATVPSLD